jgi:hypothetical protein
MLRSPLLAIFLTVFVDVLALTIAIPLLPYYAKHFGASPLVIGVLGASFAACSLLSGPLLGRLSDRFGRRPVLLVSQLGTLIGFLVLGFAQNLAMLFVGRMLDGGDGGQPGRGAGLHQRRHQAREPDQGVRAHRHLVRRGLHGGPRALGLARQTLRLRGARLRRGRALALERARDGALAPAHEGPRRAADARGSAGLLELPLRRAHAPRAARVRRLLVLVLDRERRARAVPRREAAPRRGSDRPRLRLQRAGGRASAGPGARQARGAPRRGAARAARPRRGGPRLLAARPRRVGAPAAVRGGHVEPGGRRRAPRRHHAADEGGARERAGRGARRVPVARRHERRGGAPARGRAHRSATVRRLRRGGGDVRGGGPAGGEGHRQPTRAPARGRRRAARAARAARARATTRVRLAPQLPPCSRAEPRAEDGAR